MKTLKKIVLILMLISFTITAQAQQKKSYAQQKAAENTTFVAKKMNLSKDKTTFLHSVLLNKYESNAEKNKDKNLSEEDKKAIYKQSYNDTQTKLAEQFSKEEITQINEHLKQNSKEAKN